MNRHGHGLPMIALAITLPSCGAGLAALGSDEDGRAALSADDAEHRAPPEAMQTCASLELGARCRFAVQGRCLAIADHPRSCVPQGLVDAVLVGHDGALTPELADPPTTAVAACATLADDGTCTYEMSGVCLGAEEEPLACTPRAPHAEAPDGGAPAPARAACVGASLGARCRFVLDHEGVMKGVCLEAGEAGLACVPTRDRPR